MAMFAGASLLSNAQPKAQFRAVVFCGYGSDLYPLIEPTSGILSDDDRSANAEIGNGGSMTLKKTQRQHTTGQVKALLPVAGRKMIDWVLDRVEEAGVYDILILAPVSLARPILQHIRARRSAPSTSTAGSGQSAKLELEEVPDAIARDGTVHVTRWAVEQGYIKTDFIILPCDLLLSPTSGSKSASNSLASLLDRHRVEDNLMTCLFSERVAGGVVDARKEGPSEILTIYNRSTSTLLDIREMDEYDSDEVPLRTSMLSKFPSPTLSTSLLPTQIYVFSSIILRVLMNPINTKRLRHMENFRDLAGWIARLAWRHDGKGAIGRKGNHSDGTFGREDALAMGRSTTQKPSKAPGGISFEGRVPIDGSYSAARTPSMPQTGANTPALLSRGPSWRAAGADFGDNVWNGAEGGKKHDGTNPRAGSGGCKVMIWKTSDGWCGRGNTISGWVEINRAAMKLLPPSPPATSTAQGVFISPDSLLHSSVYANLGEKVGMKRCIIGKGCIVGKGSKLINVVAMDNVVIGDNTKIENCVLSNGVQIRDRANLKDCEFGRNYIVDAEISLKGEQLVVEEDA